MTGGDVTAVEKVEGAASSTPTLDTRVWRVPLIVTAIAVAAVVALLFYTFRSIVAIWDSSDTFAHGYLIAPISLYLIWDQRERLQSVVPKPSYVALPFVALVGLGWLMSRLAGVLVLEQYFAVAAIPLVVWAILGTSAMRELAFPLGFLLFGVPIGEFLIPPLIDVTAVFTVTGLRISGVPVLQEGNLLTLSNSQWSIVEACSGLRYLIACLTLGVLYAYLTFRSWWRRALCVFASIVVPIIANGFRAYMIVMLGYLSDLKLAVGVDHLIYGWVFFGVVVLIFFWVGSFFREDTTGEDGRKVVTHSLSPTVSHRSFVASAFVVVLVLSVWPFWAARAEASEAELPASTELLPDAIDDWTQTSPEPIEWEPRFIGAELRSHRLYQRGREWIAVHVACYANQRQGSELVNSSNTVVTPESSWRVLDASSRNINGNDVEESQLDSFNTKYVTWKWFWIDGTETASSHRAKLLEMTGKLRGQPPLACGVVFMTPATESVDARLSTFLQLARPAIDTRLTRVSGSR